MGIWSHSSASDGEMIVSVAVIVTRKWRSLENLVRNEALTSTLVVAVPETRVMKFAAVATIGGNLQGKGERFTTCVSCTF